MFDPTAEYHEYAISNPAARLGNVFYLIVSNFRTILVSFLLTYLVFFIPLSYVEVGKIKSIWTTTWTFVAFTGVAFWGFYMLNNLSFLFGRKKFIPPKGELILTGGGGAAILFVLGVVIILSVIGLLPTSVFVHPFPLILLYFTAYSAMLFTLVSRYKSYLLQIAHVVQNGSVLVMVLALAGAVIEFGVVANSITDFSNNYLDFVMGSIQSVTYLIFSYIAYKIGSRIRTGNVYSIEMIIAIVLTVFVLVLRIALNYFEDFFSFSLFFFTPSLLTLLIVLDYYDANPTQRKSNKILLGGFAAFCAFSALMLVDVDFIQSSPFFTIPRDIMGMGSILVNFLVIFRKIDKEKSGDTDIPYDHIKMAAKELRDSAGISLSTGTQIINLCTMAGKYDVADELLKSWENAMLLPKEALSYLRGFVLCAEMATSGEDEILVKTSDPEMPIKQLTKNQFKIFMAQEILPKHIASYETWTYIAVNPYISNFVGKELIKRLEPYTIVKKIQDFIYTAGRILLIALVVFQFFASSLAYMLPPSFFSGILVWHTLRLSELRLKFSEAFEPYVFSDEYRDYYLYKMTDWIDTWKEDNGLMESGDVPFHMQKLEQALHWYSIIPTFYKNETPFYQYVKYRIGDLYNARSDCRGAIPYLEDIDWNIVDRGVRDVAMQMLASCYLSLDKHDEAFALLGQAELPTDVLSRSLLAKLLVEDERYEETIQVLGDIEQNIDLSTKTYLGLAYLKTGDSPNAYRVLGDALKEAEDIESEEQVAVVMFLLAETEYQEEKYFFSGEHFYQSLSNIWMYEYALPEAYFNSYSRHFKVAVDKTRELNDHDTRVYLWYFVYYAFIGEKEMALENFELHLKNAPEYEKDFTLWLLNN